MNVQPLIFDSTNAVENMNCTHLKNIKSDSTYEFHGCRE